MSGATRAPSSIAQKRLPPLPPHAEDDSLLFGTSKKSRILRKAIVISVGCIALYLSYTVLFNRVVALTLAHSAGAAQIPMLQKHQTKVPQYFQTTPELWPGPTATGKAPFLVETNPVSFAATETFVPNEPLETAVPIIGQGRNESIFRLMGHLSSYFPNPEGFGVAEFPLPDGAKIGEVHMVHRHGSRYPTTGANTQSFADRLKKQRFTASGALSFLNNWKYNLGAEILVPRGRQELFDSGVLHYYEYGQLYKPGTKIIARTTTQDRMLKSAEYFMAGFFGLEWTNNATLEVIIEGRGFNNSLAGYDNCPNSWNYKGRGGNNASAEWQQVYLQDATKRFQSMIKGYDWTIDDTFAAQTMCPYETVAFGYSMFCDLFNYVEWEGFEYAQDLAFAGGAGFQSPTGRAVGIGYVQELLARLKGQTLSYSGSQINTTLDSSLETFPLNQTLYFDFSHDTNIMAILTAMGLTQFSTFLPTDAIPEKSKRSLTVSHVTPFAARLDMEIITTPHPLDEKTRELLRTGKPTKYIHFLLNQRTLPLGESFFDCGDRIDGWCELSSFITVLEGKTEAARFEEACFGDWEPVPYGQITNGRPLD